MTYYTISPKVFSESFTYRTDGVEERNIKAKHIEFTCMLLMYQNAD